MAENKKSFILYTDQIGIITKLVLKDRKEGTNDAGELFLHIMQYVNDENPEPINFLVDMAFEQFKVVLKRDLKKYETYVEKQIQNGKKGGRPKKEETQITQPFLIEPKKAVNDNVNVNVSDNVNDIKDKSFNFKKSILEFVQDEVLVSDYIEMRKLKKASISKTVFDSLKQECDSNNFKLTDALKICIEKNWIGFKYEWVLNLKKDNQHNISNGKSTTNSKPTYRNTLVNAFRNNQQANVSDSERELSQDTEFTIVE